LCLCSHNNADHLTMVLHRQMVKTTRSCQTIM